MSPSEPHNLPTLPGTPLRDADIRERRILTERWDPDLRYAYDTGIAISRYLEGLKQGKLIGSVCGTCERLVVPPRVVCEQCLSLIHI